MLEAEWSSGLLNADRRKKWLETSQKSYREPNPELLVFWRSASTNCVTACSWNVSFLQIPILLVVGLYVVCNLLFWTRTLCLINFKSRIYTCRLFSSAITWCIHTEKLQHFLNNIENAICMLHGAWILYTELSTPLACRSLVSCYVSVGVNFMALHYSALRTVCYVLVGMCIFPL